MPEECLRFKAISPFPSNRNPAHTATAYSTPISRLMRRFRRSLNVWQRVFHSGNRIAQRQVHINSPIGALTPDSQSTNDVYEPTSSPSSPSSTTAEMGSSPNSRMDEIYAVFYQDTVPRPSTQGSQSRSEERRVGKECPV